MWPEKRSKQIQSIKPKAARSLPRKELSLGYWLWVYFWILNFFSEYLKFKGFLFPSSSSLTMNIWVIIFTFLLSLGRDLWGMRRITGSPREYRLLSEITSFDTAWFVTPSVAKIAQSFSRQGSQKWIVPANARLWLSQGPCVRNWDLQVPKEGARRDKELWVSWGRSSHRAAGPQDT